MGGERFIPIVFTLYFLLLLLDVYFAWSFARFLKSRNSSRKVITGLWIATVLMLVLSLAVNYLRLNRYGNERAEQIFLLISAIWYLPKIILVPAIIVKDIILLVSKIFRKKKSAYTTQRTEQTNIGRRKLIQNTGWIISALPFIAVIDGFVRTTTNYKVFSHDITLSKLSTRLNGLKIVQISDIHAGSIMSEKAIVDLAFVVESLKADILFVTGDFVNFDPNEMSMINPFLKNLRARYGVYGCLGNHDHYMTAKQHSELVGIIKNTGIKLLINENETIEIGGEKIQIAGVDNSSYGSVFGDMKKTLSGLENYLPTILMCHDPTEWDKDIRNKTSVDITLAGHTHGGQMGINFFGSLVTPARYVYKQYAGLYSDKSQHLYVNRGIGTIGPPMRIAIPPEVTLITLHSNEKYA